MPSFAVDSFDTCITNADQWPHLIARLPDDLEDTVFTYGAILRKRQLRSAVQLLRLLLAYACNLPLDVVAGWAASCGIAHLTRQALNARFRTASAWLNHVLTQMLAARAGLHALTELRLHLTDGTHVTRPGATGTDWRLHLTFDAGTMRFTQCELTDAHGGESLTRSAPQPGEVVVADRNYGKREGILALVLTGAQALVRIAWNTFPLQWRDGSSVDLVSTIRSVAYGAHAAWEVRMAPIRAGDPEVTGRLIASRLPAPEATAARERAIKQHKKTAKKNAAGQKAAMHPSSLETAEYLLLFTTVPETLATAAQIVALYRFRWQIELAIKRLKSILGVAELTARDPDLCRAVLLAKLLLAVLVDDLCADAEAFFPSAGRQRATPPPIESAPPVSYGLDGGADHHPAHLALVPLG